MIKTSELVVALPRTRQDAGLGFIASTRAATTLSVQVPKYKVSTQNVVAIPNTEALHTPYAGILEAQGNLQSTFF